MKETSSKKTVYVMGHRNPDTDSVVSAAAYAALKHALGETEYVAARAGKITPQTEYIMNRFGVSVPTYIPDLIPKTAYYMSGELETVNELTSLWSAVSKMEECRTKVLVVTAEDGTYKALLHYNSFAQNVLRVMNPEKKTAVLTSMSLVQTTLNAQPIVMVNEKELSKSSILVAAAQFESFKKMLDSHISENLIVIAGDRTDVQEYCIESGVRALVITAGFMLSRELRAKAEAKGVSVLVSPYDTSSTAMLIVYSTPVSAMADKAVQPVRAMDTLHRIRPALSASPSRCLPVVDENDKAIGIIAENDLLNEANIELVLVDHNERTQAVEGIENYVIREIIDHHRLGNIATRQPITFINKPVGATCTLMVGLYRENHVSIPREIASILLCGILADTLSLQSATTTDTDREAAEYLSNITNLEIETLGQEVLTAASRLSGRSASEVIHQDMKEYTEGKNTYTVSQIEVGRSDEILARKEEFLTELEIERRSHKALFSALMVTDITRLTSLLLVTTSKNKERILDFPKLEDDVYILADIVSRKKQLIPLLSEQVEKVG
ncbi:MAG: putative manganese-dependent inorganic diphosphatase [Treponemataceae bacterium]|nr:putative manganese-dependent inorganic diphosphatase [Treponemataceae bacterium]